MLWLVLVWVMVLQLDFLLLDIVQRFFEGEDGCGGIFEWEMLEVEVEVEMEMVEWEFVDGVCG